ncbi:MAG: S9 family peptidase [Candidatus Eremiobacteraeota bacterium]|nr:S9 family peptidase [Candidatus Eremiobacteraeota bacterium]
MKTLRLKAFLFAPALILTLALPLAMLRPVQAAGPFTAFPTPPPPAPVRPVTETYFGTSVTDPYRYMENMSDPQVQQFFKDQNNYARAVLARLGAPRQALFNRIKVLDNAGESVGSVQRVKNLYFYEKLKPGQNSDKLYVRVAGSASERVLVDPDRMASAGKHYTINYFTPSLDGKHVAYGISEGGSEASVIRVVDVATGRTLPDAIDRAYFVGVTSWLPDGKSFYYVRFPQLKPGEPETDKETRAVNYLHVLGRNPDQDPAILGYGIDPNIPLADTDFPIVIYSPVSKYSLALIAHGVKNEVTMYALEQSPVMAAGAPWKKIVDDSNEVTGYDVKGSTIYLLTHHDAPTFKVVSMSLATPDFAHAKAVVNPGRAVVESVQVASDGLYVLARDGGFGQISKFALDTNGNVGAGHAVQLPYSGAIGGIVTDSRVPGVTFGLTGWTRSLRYFYAAANGAVSDSHLKKPAPVNVSAYTSAEVSARSTDGTMVPLSLVYKKGIKLDGSHPAYLEGYGAYGITLEPAFSTTRVAWMERGGVYAVCHPRGGGWYGEAWHQAGMIATKHHTWEDFIACGQWLVDNHYTSPQHLAGEGTSAGGITIGRAITTKPDLFAAALDVVGVSNAMRSEFSPNGPPNIPEFGTVKNEAGFRALYEMDALAHVRDGTAYPGVMLITGYNDPRVSSWELAKMTARLQAATSSGRPILLRVDYDAGHGFLAASRVQTEQLLTDQYSFLLWQCGDPAFRSIPIRISAQR